MRRNRIIAGKSLIEISAQETSTILQRVQQFPDLHLQGMTYKRFIKQCFADDAILAQELPTIKSALTAQLLPIDGDNVSITIAAHKAWQELYMPNDENDHEEGIYAVLCCELNEYFLRYADYADQTKQQKELGHNGIRNSLISDLTDMNLYCAARAMRTIEETGEEYNPQYLKVRNRIIKRLYFYTQETHTLSARQKWRKLKQRIERQTLEIIEMPSEHN